MKILIVAFLVSVSFAKWIIFTSSHKKVMAQIDKVEYNKSFIKVEEKKEIGKKGFIRFYKTEIVKKPVYNYYFFYQNNLIYKVKCFKELDLFKDYIFIKCK
ncbi:MAG: hypothetical protein ABGX25_04915 [Nautiliaceae bacterium]